MAERIFTKSSPKDAFAVLFVNGCIPMKIDLPQNFGAQNLPFWSENSDSTSFNGHCMETRRNSGKTKTAGVEEEEY